MATKPKIVSQQINPVDALNTIRANASATYQELVPFADGSVEQLREIGEIVMTYDAVRNEFLSALYNRIGRVLITSKMYDNPWAVFKKGMLEFGETIEEVFVNIAKVFQYDPSNAETTLYKRVIPDVRSAFHSMNFQKFYENTISNDQLRQAFLSWQGITDIIARIVDSMYTAANYDEFLMMKYLIARLALNGNIKPITIPSLDATNANSIVTAIKGVSNMFEFLSTENNINGVYTHTPKADQYVIETANFNAVIDVEVLAKAFNMDKAQFTGRQAMVNQWTFANDEMLRLKELFTLSDGTIDPTYHEFTEDEVATLETIQALLVDRDFLMCYDNFVNFTEAYNAKGLYWNYFYHTWRTFSASPFHNAVLFTTDTSEVTSVTISPKTVSVQKGASTQFTVTVEASGFAKKDVAYTVKGATSPNTMITSQGLLTVGEDEEATNLTITATSVYTPGKSDSATVTITK
jgi:hypothetical protein